MSIEEKITGCLLGGAVGDALGYPVEFMNWKKIRKIYGSSGITSLESHGSKVEISDDTQMTLFTGEGLLNWLSSESKEDGPEVYLNQAYLDWYATQRQTAGYKPYTQLYGIKELHQLRAPGNACLAALRSQKNGEFGTVEKPVNNSKGCGGIMRAAPAGLIEEKEGWTAASLGAKAAAITHGHPLGYLPAALLAETVHEIVYKDPKKERELTDLLRSALRKVKLQFPQEREMETLEELTEQAIQLARKDEEDHKALRILGEGWTGEETWAVAVFACVKYSEDFQKALICSVNHEGDSDSTGAVAGNILGAYLGKTIVEQAFSTENLELKEVIDQMGERLALYSSRRSHA